MRKVSALPKYLTGPAKPSPRPEPDELLAREELEKAGVYILMGNDPLTNAARAYIGEGVKIGTFCISGGVRCRCEYSANRSVMEIVPT